MVYITRSNNGPLPARCCQEVSKIVDNEELCARERVRQITHVIKSIPFRQLGMSRRVMEKIVDLILQCGPHTRAEVLLQGQYYRLS